MKRPTGRRKKRLLSNLREGERGGRQQMGRWGGGGGRKGMKGRGGII